MPTVDEILGPKKPSVDDILGSEGDKGPKLMPGEPPWLNKLARATDIWSPLAATTAPQNIGIGAISAVPGAAGDIEALGRLAINSAVGDVFGSENVLPTSEDVGNAVFGEAQTPLEKVERAGGSVVGLTGGLRAAEAGAKVAGKVGSEITGLITGTGARPIEEAYKAGQIGGHPAKVFLANMTGKVPLEDVVKSARRAVKNMRRERNAAYQASMQGVKQNVNFLDFGAIDRELDDAAREVLYNRFGDPMFEGADSLHNSITNILQKTRNRLAARTPEDFDAMRQMVGDLHNTVKPGSKGSVVISRVDDAIAKEISRKEPRYAAIMKDYHEASNALREVESAFSLKDTKSIDTSLRKLQSVMRDNVNASQGYKGQVLEGLDKRGRLAPALAGQALSNWAPRGLARVPAELAALHPNFWAALPFASPRAAGNLAYQVGRIQPKVAKYVNPRNALLAGPALQAPQFVDDQSINLEDAVRASGQ